LLAGFGLANQPSVAILPVQNTTGEKWAELKKGLTERVQAQLLKEFTGRGFAVKGPLETKSVLDALEIDLEDEENHRREVFFNVGEKAATDYVVFFVITHNTQRTKTNLFSSVPEGEVTVKYWVMDTKQRKPILSAKSETAKARPHSALGAKGSDQQLTAADRVVTAALKDFLAQWPEKGKGG
jgi:hypothetical protein